LKWVKKRKRWTNEELLLPSQVADPALMAALSSEEGDEAGSCNVPNHVDGVLHQVIA
jgi:hypothetical protein